MNRLRRRNQWGDASARVKYNEIFPFSSPLQQSTNNEGEFLIEWTLVRARRERGAKMFHARKHNPVFPFFRRNFRFINFIVFEVLTATSSAFTTQLDILSRVNCSSKKISKVCSALISRQRYLIRAEKLGDSVSEKRKLIFPTFSTTSKISRQWLITFSISRSRGIRIRA